MKKHGKGAIKVGDILYGFYRGPHKGYREFKEVEIKKVGTKYVYGLHLQKLEMTFDNRWCPQAFDQLATDSDGYKYYKSMVAAEKAFEAKGLAIQLNQHNFLNMEDNVIFKISNLIGLKRGGHNK